MSEHLELEDAIKNVEIFINLACENLHVNGYQELCSKLGTSFHAVKKIMRETKMTNVHNLLDE